MTMPQHEVLYRPEAVADLRDIFLYVLRRSQDPKMAEQYVARVRQRCRRLGAFPSVGTPRDDLRPGLRTVAFERRAVIAYLVDGDAVVTTNVFFGGRDYEGIHGGREPEAD